MDLDFGERVESVQLGKQDKMMQHYFKEYKREGNGKRNNKKSNENSKSKMVRKMMNFLIILLILAFYALIVFNFSYHIIKPYLN